MAELKRALGFWTLLALSISSIMGTGIFFGSSIGASYSGNASILSWVIISLVAVSFISISPNKIKKNILHFCIFSH